MSRSSIALAAATAAALTVGLSAPAQAAPAERLCRGTITGAITGSIRVPSGATCTINNANVRGAINVDARGSLTVNGAVIDRSVTAVGYTRVSVTNSRVGGAISLSTGGAIALTAVVVAGSVTLTANRQGTKALKYNAISGKLSCTNNAPAPTGVANVVSGGKFGQCVRV
ncbi:MAG TPA: hypothetical protein PKH97_13765 [Tetrasphaera sp.]|uniref:hypothetical protein n=1 Tax=Nostocoides sp. TaxID=1917966 RepID=UPI002CD18C14|nr:hypothetical protein [Tetrasphaera sp.]HNQ08239.1 hypothetical protein [Tetrasphaera sp.]